MLKMAICDDEPMLVKKAEEFVRVFNSTHENESCFAVEAYTSPILLRDDILEGKAFDVFLLDMEMPEMEGDELARQIRSKLSQCVILFLSSHTEYRFTQEGYKVEALRYVSKLVMDTALQEALEAAVKVCQKKENRFYIFSHYSDTVRIPLFDIQYVHRVKRNAVIVTGKYGEFQIKQPLKELLAEMNDTRFAFADRSCFVNLDQVVKLSENELILKTGARLPVSRKMLPKMKSMLLHRWGELS